MNSTDLNQTMPLVWQCIILKNAVKNLGVLAF